MVVNDTSFKIPRPPGFQSTPLALNVGKYRQAPFEWLVAHNRTSRVGMEPAYICKVFRNPNHEWRSRIGNNQHNKNKGRGEGAVISGW